jgi:hypothetical protein
MEAITGELKPAGPEDAWTMKPDDESWLPDGFIPIPGPKDDVIENLFFYSSGGTSRRLKDISKARS